MRVFAFLRSLRPKDIVVLVMLLTEYPDGEWTYEDVSDVLKMSTSQVYYALENLDFAHLYDRDRKFEKPREIHEFLTGGVRYAFPARPGPMKRGIPTATSAPVAEGLFVGSGGDAPLVWPDPEGDVRGQSIEPLYDKAPVLVDEHPELYDWLALIDIMRVGSARERNVAAEELGKRLTR